MNIENYEAKALSIDDIKYLEDICEGASEAPWVMYDTASDAPEDNLNKYTCVQSTDWAPDKQGSLLVDNSPGETILSEADANFIATARAAMPMLLNQLRQLRIVE